MHSRVLIYFGLGQNFFIILNALIVLVRDLFNSFMCASKFNLSSSIIPKYFTSFTLFITSLSILMLFRHPGITPFLLNMEYAVLLMLAVSLLV